MKTIGLLGGMSWESTLTYYRLLNEHMRLPEDPLRSARLLLWNANFSEIAAAQHRNEWDALGVLLGDAAQKLEAAGADAIAIATNLMHRVAPEVQRRISVPLLHIADAVADQLVAAGVKRAGLLGARATMEEDFYRERLAGRGIETVIPNKESRDYVHRIIYTELCCGVFSPESKRGFQQVVSEFQDAGCSTVILGCTEIGLLLKEIDSAMALCDSTTAHAGFLSRWATAD